MGGRAQALLIAVAALLPGAALPDDECPLTLRAGDVFSCSLAGPDGHRFDLDSRGGAMLTVENLGRGTILTIEGDNGELLRAANWRGPEHAYVAVFESSGPVTVRIDPDEPIARRGEFRLRVDAIDPADPRFPAERAMTLGADRHLQHYFGLDDARQEARKFYLEAANSFAALGRTGREADALFEAAVVSRHLGDTALAMRQFARAEQAFTAVGDRRGLASAENQRGLVNWELGRASEAIQLFQSAAGHRNALGDDYFYAESLNNVGLVHRDLGDAWLAIEYFRRALELWQGDTDLGEDGPVDIDFPALATPPWLTHALTALNNLGWAQDMIGASEIAEQHWQRALALATYLDRGRMAAELNNNLGTLYRNSGRLQLAKQRFDAALRYFTSDAGNERWAALVHFNLGSLHRAAGDDVRAERSFQRSLELRTAGRDPVGRAETLKELAEIGLDRGEIEKTLADVDAALALIDAGVDDVQLKGSVLDLAARACAADGRYECALRRHDDAVAMFRAVDDRRGEVRARSNRAQTKLAAGFNMDAQAELRVALGAAEQIGARSEQFGILTRLGRVYLADGEATLAAEHANRAIELSETLRQELVHPLLLRNFAAVQRDAYDVLVEAALAEGRIEAAWQTADEARARRFTDLLGDAPVDLASLDPAERERYLTLRRAIAARTERRAELLAAGKDDDAARVGRELDPMVDEIEELTARARPHSAGASASVTLAEITPQLGPGQAVLEYFVGEATAGVWRISRGGIDFFDLGDPDALAAEVADVLEATLARRTPASSQLAGLSRTLLAAALSEDDRSLVIVPDASLHLLPFALLLDPFAEDRRTILGERSLSYLPSLAALLELRARKRASGAGIAVLADPVFDRDDARVADLESTVPAEQVAMLDTILMRGPATAGADGFPRLPGTLREAEIIAEVAGDSDILTLTGTDASREAVLNGRLDGYEILHFATHGVLDAEEPALSGLILAGVTAAGQPQRRFLGSQDIAALDLSARLVVLSGCDTARGRVVRGEGLLGLSRAFFYAGAEQVVSSLWQVPDSATAALMASFYRELLGNGQPPQTALRLAQLEVRQNPRWRSPFYWAAFILQGDWR